MFHNASNDVERGFAWGWVTHVLGDVLLHPIINEWCAGQFGHEDSLAEQLRLHVRLEINMDVMHVAAVKRAGIPTFRSTFDESTVALLTNAYQDTYAMDLDPRVLVKAHRNLEVLCRRLLELELVLAGAVPPTLSALPNCVALNVVRALAAVSNGPRSLVTAFLYPVLPPLELGLQFRDRLDKFQIWFERCVATDLRCLPNVDLSTGLEIGEHESFAVA